MSRDPSPMTDGWEIYVLARGAGEQQMEATWGGFDARPTISEKEEAEVAAINAFPELFEVDAVHVEVHVQQHGRRVDEAT